MSTSCIYDIFVAFLKSNGWDKYLRNLDWAGFGKHYNGPRMHHNLQKLADSIDIGRAYTSQVCKALGEFYYLVNKYRVEYAEEYKRKHPDAIKEKVAVESGFTDRNAYRRALESTSSKYSDA